MDEQKQNPDTPPQEESIFNEADFSMRGYDKHIKNARNMLFVIAGLNLLSLFMMGPVEDDDVLALAIGITVFISAVFVGLAFWTKYKPFAALLTALIFYVALYILFGILDPTTLFSGVILKAVAVILLIMGVRNAKEAEDLKKTYGR